MSLSPVEMNCSCETSEASSSVIYSPANPNPTLLGVPNNPGAPRPVAITRARPSPSPSPSFMLRINPEEIELLPLPTEEMDVLRMRIILSRPKKNLQLTEEEISYVCSYYYHCEDMYFLYHPETTTWEPHSYSDHYNFPTKPGTIDYFFVFQPVKLIYDANLPVSFTVPFRNANDEIERRRVLNLYPHISVERCLYEEFSDDAKLGVDLYWRHVRKVLCSKNEKLFTFVRYWIIHVLNLRRTRVALYNTGSGGTGKSMAFNMLLRIIGTNHSLMDDRGLVVSSRFNAPLANKILIVLEEAPCEGKSKYVELGNNLKNLIDGLVLSIERKCKDRTDKAVKNYANLVIITNYTKATIKFDKDSEGERRYCFTDINNKYAYKEGQPVHKWLNKVIPYFGNPADEDHNPELKAKRDNCACALYNYCLEEFANSKEIQHFDFQSNIPITKTQIRLLGRDKIQQIIFYLFVEANIFQLDIYVKSETIFSIAKTIIEIFDLDITFDYTSARKFYPDLKKAFPAFYVSEHDFSAFKVSYSDLCAYFNDFTSDYAESVRLANDRSDATKYNLLNDNPDLISYYSDYLLVKANKKDKENLFDKKWSEFDYKFSTLENDDDVLIDNKDEQIKDLTNQVAELQRKLEEMKTKDVVEEVIYVDEDGNEINQDDYKEIQYEEEKAEQKKVETSNKKPNERFTGERKKLDQ